MSDRVVSILRTAVPTAWGALLGLLLPHLPWLPVVVREWLSSTAVVEFVVGLCIVAWYAAWRWAEPRIPAWLVTLVLGSSKAPVYRRKVDPAVDAEYRFWAAQPSDVTDDWSSPEDATYDGNATASGTGTASIAGSLTVGGASAVWWTYDPETGMLRPAPTEPRAHSDGDTPTAEDEADAQAAGNDRTDFPYA